MICFLFFAEHFHLIVSNKNQKGDCFIAAEKKFQNFFGFPLTLSDDGVTGTPPILYDFVKMRHSSQVQMGDAFL